MKITYVFSSTEKFIELIKKIEPIEKRKKIIIEMLLDWNGPIIEDYTDLILACGIDQKENVYKILNSLVIEFSRRVK